MARQEQQQRRNSKSSSSSSISGRQHQKRQLQLQLPPSFTAMVFPCPGPTFLQQPAGSQYYTVLYIRRPRQTQGGARQGIILLTLVSDYYRSRRSSSNSRRSKAGLRVACYCEWFRSQVAVAEQPAVGRCFCCLCGPEVGVGGSSRQRQSFNFLGVPLLCFGDEIRCCFAVSDVSKRVSGCLFLALEAVWLQQHHSRTTAAAAATSSCTSSRQQQGAAGSSRQAAAAFSGMVFRCGEGYVLEACSSSCFVFNKIQKGRQHWMDWIGFDF